MAIQTSCPNCDAPYTLADTQRGKRVRCKKCSDTFVVGGSKPAAEEAPARAGARSGKFGASPGAGRSAPPKTAPKGRRPADDDEDDRDAKPEVKKKSGGSPMPMILMIGGGVLLLLMLVCGGVVAVAYFSVKSATQNAVDNITAGLPDPNHPGIVIGPNGLPVDPGPVDFNNPFGPPPPKDVREALDWIKNGDTASKKNVAANWLGKVAKVDEALRPQVAAELEKMVTNPNTHDAGVVGLGVWATRDDVPTLVKEADADGTWQFGSSGGPAGDALVRLKDERAAPVFARRLPNFFEHGNAATRLRNLGPVAEKEVLKYMHSSNGDARNEAASLLKSYGTKDDVLFNQTLTDINGADNESIKSACDWLAAHAVVPARQAEVAKALGTALNNADGNVQAEAMKGLNVWATKDSVPDLVAWLDRDTGPFVSDNFKTCLNLLVRLKDEKGAEAVARQLPNSNFKRDEIVNALRKMGPVAKNAVGIYLTHPDNGIRDAATNLLKGYGAGADVFFDAHLTDLNGGDLEKRKAAADWLVKQPVLAAKQGDVARALDLLLLENDGGAKDNAVKALAVWGDKDSVPGLIRELERDNGNNWSQCIDILVKLKDERGAEAIIRQLRVDQHKGKAAQALNLLGPVAEKALLPGLDERSAAVRIEVCQFLEKYGTKDVGLPALQQLSAKEQVKTVKAAADKAIKAINDRNP